LRAEEHRRQAEETRQLLLDESQHRIKNTLATVQAMARQTLRHASPADLDAFLARLHTLSEAHDLLSTKDWHRAPIDDVIHRALRPFSVEHGHRVVANGPPVLVPATSSLHLTLCLHELATNATKYGALSNAAGQVRLSWSVPDANRQRLELSWEEIGGPPVTPPERKGFGTLLIQSSGLTGARLDFAPQGLKCFLDLPI
jgi:two-component sensor histidine kinase